MKYSIFKLFSLLSFLIITSVNIFSSQPIPVDPPEHCADNCTEGQWFWTSEDYDYSNICPGCTINIQYFYNEECMQFMIDRIIESVNCNYCSIPTEDIVQFAYEQVIKYSVLSNYYPIGLSSIVRADGPACWIDELSPAWVNTLHPCSEDPGCLIEFLVRKDINYPDHIWFGVVSYSSTGECQETCFEMCDVIVGIGDEIGKLSVLEFDKISKKDMNILFYPNPSSNVLNLTIEGELEGEILFKVSNIMGQSVLSLEDKLVTGQNQFFYNLDKLINGTYYFQLFLNGEVLKTGNIIVK